LLKIRRFIAGEDDGIWVSILNQAFKEYEDLRPLTLEDMEDWKKYPAFDDAGMLIAEVDGKPVGCVNAFVDKQREEKKGFISHLGVVLEHRGRGIGRALLVRAIESLKERGMECAEALIQEGKVPCQSLFESMGFCTVRSDSEMVRELSKISSNIGENLNVSIIEATKSDEEIRIFNRLYNEAFKEHFNFRPETLEETSFWVKESPWMDVAKYFFAYLNDEPVGFVGVGIDNKYNEYHKKKRGCIFTIGVLKPLRRQGIGTTLMLHALNLLKTYGMNEAALGVDDKNPTHAMELYKKLGFQVIRKNLTYQKKFGS